MDNVRFSYLYRDGSNFKSVGSVVFRDPDGASLVELRTKLEAVLPNDGLFIAHHVRIPEVFLYGKWNVTADDHCYHEFHSVEKTCEPPNDKYGRSVREFVAEVDSNRDGEPFDPFDRWLRNWE